MKNIVTIIFATIVFAAGAFAQGAPLILRQPTMNKTDIVFSFGGDLW